jgi:outer membrane biogenesis lipoprotein LolB
MKIALAVLAIVAISFITGCTCSCKKGHSTPQQYVTQEDVSNNNIQVRVEIKEFQDHAVVKQLWQKIKDGSDGNYQVAYELQLSSTYVSLILSSSLPGTLSVKKTLQNMLQNEAVQIHPAGENELIITPR